MDQGELVASDLENTIKLINSLPVNELKNDFDYILEILTVISSIYFDYENSESGQNTLDLIELIAQKVDTVNQNSNASRKAYQNQYNFHLSLGNLSECKTVLTKNLQLLQKDNDLSIPFEISNTLFSLSLISTLAQDSDYFNHLKQSTELLCEFTELTPELESLLNLRISELSSHSLYLQKIYPKASKDFSDASITLYEFYKFHSQKDIPPLNEFVLTNSLTDS